MTIEATAPVAVKEIIILSRLGELLAAVKAAGVGVAKRPPVPIMSGLLVESEHSEVTLTGYDYETVARARVAHSLATEAGRAVLPYRQLLDVLTAAGKRATKRISDEWDAVLTISESKASLEINGVKYTLTVLPHEEFPHPPVRNIEGRHDVLVDTDTFIRSMDAAVVAASRDDTLPILTHVRVEVEGCSMRLMGTDRYRLVLAEFPVIGEVGVDFTALIPATLWTAVKRTLGPVKGREALISVAVDGDQVEIVTNQGVFGYSHEGRGEYPKIRSLFPEYTPIGFDVDADALRIALDTVAVAAERNTPVRLSWEDEVVTLDAGTGEEIQATATVPFTSHDGSSVPFVVAFNPHFLRDALTLFKGQRVTFGHTSAPKPAVIKGADVGSDLQYLIMPVRLP